MIIKSISYQKVKNLGNYESERLEATATVEEDECVGDAVDQLRAFVELKLEQAAAIDTDPFCDPDPDPLFDTSLKSNLVHDTLNESDETDGDF